MAEQLLASLAVQASAAALSGIREQIMGAAAAAGTDAGVLQRLDLVLEEAVLNVVLHGYGGNGGILDVALYAAADGSLKLIIADNGVPFDPLTVPQPDLTLPLEERPVGGLGVHLIRTLVDQVTYCRDGSRNLLTLTFAGRIARETCSSCDIPKS